MKMFISDNASGVHPDVMKAISDCNIEHEKPYGNDSYSKNAIEQFKIIFGQDTDITFVLTGTGANVIGLAGLLRPYESVICARTGHVNIDECGAFERFSGSKLEQVEGLKGKLTPELITPCLSAIGNEHHTQPKVVSISQVTEMGTVYTVDEIKELSYFCHDNGLLLHMDGARVANAAVALGLGFKEITKDAGVDLLSFGGTKNGMMMGEAIVSFNPVITSHLKFVRKQGMHLASKMRYISAQFTAYLDDNVWRKNAEHANRMTAIISDCMAGLTKVNLVAEPHANMIFAEIPKSWNEILIEKYPYYVLEPEKNLIRLVTSFDTSEDDVDGFIDLIGSL